MNKKLTKAMLLIMIMVLAVVTLTGCGEDATKTNDSENLPVYSADEDMTGYTKCEQMAGVEFYYPSNYISVGKATQPIFSDPELIGASVNLASSTFPSAYTFEGYIDASIATLKKQMTTISGDIEKEYINLNGNKACKLTYVMTAQGKSMQATQILIVKDSKAYALTLGCLLEDKEAFQPKLEKMIKSFK